MKSFVASYSLGNFPKRTLPAPMIALKTENLKEKEKYGTGEAKIL
jgi:hypothetical protein